MKYVPDFPERYPSLGPQDATALVRAARHYATAVWVADSDPEQAWLQLVSALETVATQWRTTKADPTVVFTDQFPEAARLIQESGEVDLLAAISPYFQRLIGAGHRFAEFVETFKPSVPYPRPVIGRNIRSGENVSAQVDWSDLRPVVKRIYSCRSELLHNGTPFPADLCVPPLEIDGVPEERPLGLGSTVGNTSWSADDTPIRLHTFAYLARGAIVNWWESVVPKSDT